MPSRSTSSSIGQQIIIEEQIPAFSFRAQLVPESFWNIFVFAVGTHHAYPMLFCVLYPSETKISRRYPPPTPDFTLRVVNAMLGNILPTNINRKAWTRILENCSLVGFLNTTLIPPKIGTGVYFLLEYFVNCFEGLVRRQRWTQRL